MAMHERKMIDLEQGWEFMQKGITKLKNILEGLPEPQFSSEDYMMLYTTIYNMCTHKPPHDYSQQLYDKYHKSFQEYITSTTLGIIIHGAKNVGMGQILSLGMSSDLISELHPVTELNSFLNAKSEIEDTILLALHSRKVYDDIARGTWRKFESNRPRAVLFEGPSGLPWVLQRVFFTSIMKPILQYSIETSKPKNILVGLRFNAKVADFGLSRLAPVPDIEGTIPGHVSTVVKGTPGVVVEWEVTEEVAVGFHEHWLRTSQKYDESVPVQCTGPQLVSLAPTKDASFVKGFPSAIKTHMESQHNGGLLIENNYAFVNSQSEVPHLWERVSTPQGASALQDQSTTSMHIYSATHQ
ncbi:hypothetical protein IFM89_038554 [Coptis chinensis]|uniref:Cullin N-terminal domain-containing protein n=1 Tax=Coptis chinensis TaxID=261450 RepID=A0A835HHQ2_9MAGN|nr:hypothetical protein IFM89_038554 [Coptis chinensis]